ncbi:MAG: SEC-C domain-containing protein [Proteobacteria bacterium]|nr:SEC-C domain-containing protein [Pseudomonadota bacterium]
MKPGRNDPCPCGSGRKYKHCCLAEPATIGDLGAQTWRRMRAARDGFAADMLGFVTRSYGADVVRQAWFEFTLGREEQFAAGHPNTELFFSWLFHVWVPQVHKGNVITDTTLFGVPPSQAYLDRRGARLNPLLKRYLEACLATPFAFHEICDCWPGAGFTTRNVFTGRELEVRERSASATLARGDIVFGQIVAVSGIAMVEALGSYALPPSYKTHLVQVRSRPELQHASDLALRTLYLSLADAYVNPPPPRLHNTDGDPLEPRTLYFEIDSAPAAFEALAPLALGSPREELLAEAKFDAKGAVIEAEIPWIRRNGPKHDLETVVLGHFHIAARKLKVEVNSLARARTVRALVAETPGLNARYLRTRKHTLDLRRAAGRPAAGAGFRPRDDEQEELLKHPEVRAKLEQLQRRHYENWPEVALPALNNKTPLEAVRDPDGREMVDALITQFERDAARMPVPPDPAVFGGLRRRLGL